MVPQERFGGMTMSSISRKIKRNKSVKEKLIDYGYGAINHTATKYIIKYVDKKFSPTYWIEHTHGTTDYNEMPKLILYEMKQQLCYFLPLTFGNEKYTKQYERIESILNQTSDYELNTQYVETFKIDLNEIKKDAFEMLKHYFENYTEKTGEN